MKQEKKYYQIAQEASLNIGKHPGLNKLQKIAQKSKNILDVGSGEGSRLNMFAGTTNKGTGVDVSSFAIKTAKKQYPNHHFVLVKGAKLPFPDNSFDFVYSTFVLEHTQDPELFVREMVRVTKESGTTAILCPNYGSPNRRSPVSTEKPLTKLVSGYLSDILKLNSKSLSFTKVTPRKIFKNPDDDTTCEPYLWKLITFLKNIPEIRIITESSLWEIDNQATSPHQRIFKFLGLRNIFPFKYWGPQLFIVLKKSSLRDCI